MASITPELIIFDCDGVLIDSEPLSSAALITTLAAAGVVIDTPFVQHHLLGQSLPSVRAKLEARFGVTLTEAFETRFMGELLERFERELQALPFVADVVAQLTVASCVATSSSPQRVQRALALTGLAPLFGERVFTASQVARGKPAPDLFLYAAAQMGVAPAKCLVIEDSPAGVEAALAAEMAVWRFVGGGHFDSELALDLPLPDAPPAQRQFRCFSTFFDPLPQLQRRQR